MAKRVKIWQKRQLRLDLLTFPQRDMVRIGSAGLLSVFKRLSQARGPEDGPAKPLSKKYAIYKSRMHKGNRRDLFFTGQLLRSLRLRTVNDNSAYAAPGGDKRQMMGKASKGGKPQKSSVTNRDVARGNMKREPWLVFSPVNRQAVMEKARQVFLEAKARLIKWGKVA